MVFHFIGEVKPKRKENLSESRRATGHLNVLCAPSSSTHHAGVKLIPSPKESTPTLRISHAPLEKNRVLRWSVALWTLWGKPRAEQPG